MVDNITEAVICYLQRQARYDHPDGHGDNGGRWYPSDSERQACCNSIREPSRSFPWSLMTHCRTLKHICNLFKVDEKEVRYRMTKEGLPLLVGSGNTWLDSWLDKKFRQEGITC